MLGWIGNSQVTNIFTHFTTFWSLNLVIRRGGTNADSWTSTNSCRNAGWMTEIVWRSALENSHHHATWLDCPDQHASSSHSHDSPWRGCGCLVHRPQSAESNSPLLDAMFKKRLIILPFEGAIMGVEIQACGFNILRELIRLRSSCDGSLAVSSGFAYINNQFSAQGYFLEREVKCKWSW